MTIRDATLLSLFVTLSLGCTETKDSDSATDSGTSTDTDTGVDTGTGTDTTGTAELTFSLHLDASWSNDEWDINGCIQGSMESSIGCDEDALDALVVMLCQTSDPQCESPAVIRGITDAENEEGTMVQDGYGTDIRVGSLPAGDWLVMLMIDGSDSILNAHGWESGFTATETAWAGVASVGDLLLAAALEEPTADQNPVPAPWAITLTDDAVTNIGEDPPRLSNTDAYGSVWLSHYHREAVR
jgi:hypothetical protein